MLILIKAFLFLRTIHGIVVNHAKKRSGHSRAVILRTRAI